MKRNGLSMRACVVCVASLAGAVAPVLVFAGMAGPAILIAGCKKKPPPAPPPPPPPPPAPPKAPDPINVQSVMDQAKPDPRVQFPQSAAPTDTSLANAIIQFSNSLVKGDSEAFGKSLSRESKIDLDTLVSSGEWEASASKLEAVRVVGTEDLAPSGDGVMSAARVLLAVQEPGEAYTLAWTARKKGSDWEFDASQAPEGVKRRASDWDNGGTGSGSASSDSPTNTTSTTAAAPAASKDLTSVFAWANKEMERRVLSASKNNGVATPAPPAPADVRAALDAGISPGSSDVQTIVNLGLAKAKEGGNVVSNDKVFQYASQILAMPEATVRQLYGQGNEPAPAAPPQKSGGG